MNTQHYATAATRTFRLRPKGGVGFDDLWFSKDLHATLAPAGGTGCLEVFDDRDLTRRSLCDVAQTGPYAGGHSEGTTSADFGAGFVFAADRGSHSLKIVGWEAGRVLGTARLDSEPDYVRWAGHQREVWVTEPDQERIQLLRLASDGSPQLTAAPAIVVPGGPESLVMDADRAVAFTHLWRGRSVRIDLTTHAVGQSFPNGCEASRGIGLEPARGLLFAGCAEGKLVVLDSEHPGRIHDEVVTPSGVDIIAVNPLLHHVYVPASSDGSVSVFGVSSAGKLDKLGVFQAEKGAHCAASDEHGRVWVCAPESASLLVFDDPFPPTLN